MDTLTDAETRAMWEANYADNPENSTITRIYPPLATTDKAPMIVYEGTVSEPKRGLTTQKARVKR